MFETKSITKGKAFSIHLGISFIIFLILLNFILFSWYPSFLFDLEGGWRGIGIIAGVDIVLGPLLTLIVFKQGKPGLKFDLCAIAFIQFVSLFMGTWVVYTQRPEIVIFANDRFFSISHEQATLAGVTESDLRKYSVIKPAMAIVGLPKDEDERMKVLNESFAKGGLHLRGDLYLPYNKVTYKEIVSSRLKMKDVIKDDKSKQQRFNDFVKKHTLDLNNTDFFPLYGRYNKQVIIAVDRINGKFIDAVNIAPPPIDGIIRKKKIS